MGEARIKAGIWVSAALRVGMLENKPGVVVRKGDADAGGVLVKLYGRAGCVVLSQFRDMEGEVAWMRATGAEPVDEQTADGYIARQTRFDPDLWVLEFEAPDHLPPFEGKIV
ncbi:MAG: DUF1491 family protein [Rhodospirillales bacterium]|nr:DUF1491 family protein [Rhodospirillales bacterium]